MVIAREVFSDNNFNLGSRCSHCGKPVARAENGKEIAPILAIGTLTESGALDDAATLCSACASATGFQKCYQAATTHTANPQGLHCIYQVVGSPREQARIERLIQLLDQSGGLRSQTTLG